MSYGDALTVQGLTAARGIARAQRRNENGYTPFGDSEPQALRNSVVDVVVNVGDANRVFFYDARLAQSLKDRLNASGFKVLAFDASNLGSFGGGGTIRARVQILSDGYANANDAASVVAGAAAALGYNATGSSGVVVQSGSGQQQGSGTGQTGSGQTYENPNAPGSPNPVTTLLDSLTQSPISLAVIVGGIALLVLSRR